jgi:uncharacterized repeat protein (TIGR01451 family)
VGSALQFGSKKISISRICAATGAFALATLGAAVVMAGPAQAAPFVTAGSLTGNDKFPLICHATASASNPYVDQSSLRPIDFLDTNTGGHGYSGVNAGDIVPPFVYTYADGTVADWSGGDGSVSNGWNWDTVMFTDRAGNTFTGQQIWENGCNAASGTSTITVTKIVQDASGTALADQSDADGFQFAGTIKQNSSTFDVTDSNANTTLTTAGGQANNRSTATGTVTALLSPRGDTVTFAISETNANSGGYLIARYDCTIAGGLSFSGTTADATSPPFQYTGQNISCTFRNNQVGQPGATYTAELQKYQTGTTTPLENAQFDLCSAPGPVCPDGSNVGSYTTDINGTITVDNLGQGSYYWIETTPPDGYQLTTEAIPAVVFNDTSLQTVQRVVYDPPTPAPGVSLTKTATVIHNGTDTGDVLYTEAGDQVHYTFTVTNTGNQTLDGVTVNDPSGTGTKITVNGRTIGFTGLGSAGLGDITCAVGNQAVTNGAFSLAPLEVATCTASYTVATADMTAGTIDNTAYVSTSDSNVNSDPASADVQDPPVDAVNPTSDPPPSDPSAAVTITLTGAGVAATINTGNAAPVVRADPLSVWGGLGISATGLIGLALAAAKWRRQQGHHS